MLPALSKAVPHCRHEISGSPESLLADHGAGALSAKSSLVDAVLGRARRHEISRLPTAGCLRLGIDATCAGSINSAVVPSWTSSSCCLSSDNLGLVFWLLGVSKDAIMETWRILDSSSAYIKVDDMIECVFGSPWRV